MKNILHFAIVFTSLTILNIAILPGVARADTLVVGDINEDTVWSSGDGPYILQGNVYVDNGVNLIIESGTIVKFELGASLIVQGHVDMRGAENDEIYFTSILDDSVGGDTNFDEDATSPSIGDWRFILFDSGSVSGILNNVVSRYSEQGLIVFDAYLSVDGFNSDQDIYFFNSTGSDLSRVSVPSISFFDRSGASISDSTISGPDNTPILVLYEENTVNILNTTISCISFCGNVVSVYNSSVLNIESSGISSDSGGVYVFDSTLNVTDSVIDNRDNGISLYDSSLSISDSTIKNSQNFGIGVYNFSLQNIEITNNEIKNNGIGIVSYGEAFSAHDNSIHGNTVGVSNEAIYMGDLIVDSNWWGSKTGPYHDTLNIYGLGDRATDGVSYYPWLPYDPLSSEMSNVLFIPGFQGSRLYRQKTLPIIGNVEDKLWEPNTNSDITDMMMDNFGISLDENIYTRDIVDKKSALFFTSDIIYESFMNDMDALVSSNTMADWMATPYDWRYDPVYVVEHGSVDINGNIFYENELFGAEDSYIVKQVENLISTSKSGRITLVAHSNGGLVLKALMVKLEQMKTDGLNDYVDYIDKVIMVATPQIGTPKAVASILHGYDQELYSGVIMKQSVARNFAIRLPGAYGLLPTSKYFYNVVDSPVVFDQSLSKINNFYKIFGEKISNYEDFVDFLLAKKKDRTTPAVSMLETPAILFPGIFNDSVDIHEQLDNYIFPSKTKVYQLAGWGLPTLKAVRYFSRADCIPISIFSKKCKIENNLDVDPVFTDDGDETVVTPSANYILNGNSYYLNIDKYANDLNIPLDKVADHARIFDISYTREWIKNILKNNFILPNYVTKTKPPSKQNLVMYIHTTPGVDKNVSITDKDGNNMGIRLGIPSDPETTDFIPYIQEIPGGFYSMMGRNHYIYLSYSGADNYRVNITPAENSSGDTASGSVVIRQDVVTGDTIDSSVTVPSIPVSPDTIISTDIGPDGSINDVEVDNEGDGNVDYIVPSIPTENPQSPVQNNDNMNSEIIPDIDISKSYGSNAVVHDERGVVATEEVVESRLNTTDIQKEGDPALISSNPEIIDSDTGNTGVASVFDEYIYSGSNLSASVLESEIEIPWLKILNTILIAIIISLVLYKFMYKVK
ncbi:MAG: hypothetical protein KBB62_01450 [Candidatus Pacebacteria bacterium]|nr:hypothetical protein [Candidatus Paceibacterota bacterium]